MAATTTKRRQRKKLNKRGSLIKKYGTFLDGLTRLPNKCRQKMVNDTPKNVIDCVGECLLSSKQVKLPEKKKIINQKRRSSALFVIETFTWSNHRICSWWLSTAPTTSLWKGVRWLSYHLIFGKI